MYLPRKHVASSFFHLFSLIGSSNLYHTVTHFPGNLFPNFGRHALNEQKEENF